MFFFKCVFNDVVLCFFKHLMKSTEQPRKIIEHDEQTIDFHKNNNHTHTHRKRNIIQKDTKKTHIFNTSIERPGILDSPKKTYMPILKKSHIEIIKEN